METWFEMARAREGRTLWLRGAAILLLLATGFPGRYPAAATPPEMVNLRMVPFCVLDDRIAGFVTASSNRGYHQIRATSWHLVLLDYGKEHMLFEDLGELVATLGWQDDGETIEEVRKNGSAIDIAAVLQGWYMTNCGIHDGNVPSYGAAEVFTYEVDDGALQIRFDGRSRPVDARRILDISSQFYREGITWGAEPVVDATPFAWLRPDANPLALSNTYTTPAFLFDGEVHLQSRVVIFIRSLDEDMASTTLLVEVDSGELDGEKSWLLNAKGMTFHRKKDFRESRHMFWAALETDSSNDTARFNLACAQALLGDVTRAIETLQPMKNDADLRARIRKDADFDRIRQNPEFLRFVRQLR